MDKITRDCLINALKTAGNYNNDRLIEVVGKAQDFYHFQLPSLEFLLGLVFHYHKNTAVLTPNRWWGGGRLYPFADVIDRLYQQKWQFQDLAAGKISGNYLPDFFRVCQEIYQAFDYEKMGALVLRPLNVAEKKDCPNSFFRIIDGMHRALVLAYRCKEEPSFFKKVPCYLVVP